MKLYRQNRALSVVDLGECDEMRALAELKSTYEAALQSYGSGEEALEKTGFGLSRTDEDFLEACCNGRESVVFHSDRLVFGSKFTRFFCVKQHYRILVDRAKAEQVIRDYFRMPRETFEAAYQAFATR
ncbi:MAG TPA: hypothetical protein P5555_21250 [Candidatus Paceibacterota bacterium]|nr:hypothetical protein [Verrucomicrobiota bacterium]HRZ47709.1 hypothetical protein [Candidatus Paceibacterota bacterium]